MPARHRLGNLHLSILTDGVYFQDAGAVFGIVPRVLWERLGIELNDRYQMALGLNSLLVRVAGQDRSSSRRASARRSGRWAQTERPGGISLLDELARRRRRAGRTSTSSSTRTCTPTTAAGTRGRTATARTCRRSRAPAT